MHNLKIYTSNHMEILAQELARIVRDPLPPPLVPEIIVVQSRGMERWVSMEIVKKIIPDLPEDSPFDPVIMTFKIMNVFVKKIIPDLPEDSPFDPVIMTFKIMNVLQSSIDLPGYERLKHYLAHDKNGMKRFQISRKIADLFDQYLVFRPEMMFEWEKGEEDHWQAQLWREISTGTESLHRARMRKTLLEKIRTHPHEIKNFPHRISIFGISYLPPFHLETFIEISRISEPLQGILGRDCFSQASKRNTEKIHNLNGNCRGTLPGRGKPAPGFPGDFGEKFLFNDQRDGLPDVRTL